MFDNVGKSIKFASKILFYVLLAIAIVGGIVLFFDKNLWWLGIVVIILGSFFSYIISLGLYGYGEIVENAEPKKKIRDKKSRKEYLEQKLVPQVKCANCGKLHDYDDGICPECGFEPDIKEFDNQDFYCPKCGRKHKFECTSCPKCKYKYVDFD